MTTRRFRHGASSFPASSFYPLLSDTFAPCAIENNKKQPRKNRGGMANKETLGTTRALRSHLANKINGVRGGRRGERKTQKRRGGVHQRPSTQFPAAGQWSLIAAQAQLNTNICVCNPQLKQHNSDGSLSCFGRGLRHQLPFVLK